MVRIRRADLEEASALAALCKLYGLPSEGIVEAPDNFYVAEARGQIIGGVGAEMRERELLLRSLVVDEKSRQRGAGSRLVEHVFELARNKEVRRIYLLTETAADFFARFGFRQLARASAPEWIKEHPEFRTLCSQNALLMVKEL